MTDASQYSEVPSSPPVSKQTHEGMVPPSEEWKKTFAHWMDHKDSQIVGLMKKEDAFVEKAHRLILLANQRVEAAEAETARLKEECHLLRTHLTLKEATALQERLKWLETAQFEINVSQGSEVPDMTTVAPITRGLQASKLQALAKALESELVQSLKQQLELANTQKDIALKRVEELTDTVEDLEQRMQRLAKTLNVTMSHTSGNHLLVKTSVIARRGCNVLKDTLWDLRDKVKSTMKMSHDYCQKMTEEMEAAVRTWTTKIYEGEIHRLTVRREETDLLSDQLLTLGRFVHSNLQFFDDARELNKLLVELRSIPTSDLRGAHFHVRLDSINNVRRALHLLPNIHNDLCSILQVPGESLMANFVPRSLGLEDLYHASESLDSESIFSELAGEVRMDRDDAHKEMVSRILHLETQVNQLTDALAIITSEKAEVDQKLEYYLCLEHSTCGVQTFDWKVAYDQLTRDMATHFNKLTEEQHHDFIHIQDMSALSKKLNRSFELSIRQLQKLLDAPKESRAAPTAPAVEPSALLHAYALLADEEEKSMSLKIELESLQYELDSLRAGKGKSEEFPEEQLSPRSKEEIGGEAMSKDSQIFAWKMRARLISSELVTARTKLADYESINRKSQFTQAAPQVQNRGCNTKGDRELCDAETNTSVLDLGVDSACSDAVRYFEMLKDEKESSRQLREQLRRLQGQIRQLESERVTMNQKCEQAEFLQKEAENELVLLTENFAQREAERNAELDSLVEDYHEEVALNQAKPEVVGAGTQRAPTTASQNGSSQQDQAAYDALEGIVEVGKINLHEARERLRKMMTTVQEKDRSIAKLSRELGQRETELEGALSYSDELQAQLETQIQLKEKVDILTEEVFNYKKLYEESLETIQNERLRTAADKRKLAANAGSLKSEPSFAADQERDRERIRQLHSELRRMSETADELKLENERLELKIQKLENSNRQLTEDIKKAENSIKIHEALHTMKSTGGGKPVVTQVQGPSESTMITELEPPEEDPANEESPMTIIDRRSKSIPPDQTTLIGENEALKQKVIALEQAVEEERLKFVKEMAATKQTMDEQLVVCTRDMEDLRFQLSAAARVKGEATASVVKRERTQLEGEMEMLKQQVVEVATDRERFRRKSLNLEQDLQSLIEHEQLLQEHTSEEKQRLQATADEAKALARESDAQRNVLAAKADRIEGENEKMADEIRRLNAKNEALTAEVHRLHNAIECQESQASKDTTEKMRESAVEIGGAEIETNRLEEQLVHGENSTKKITLSMMIQKLSPRGMAAKAQEVRIKDLELGNIHLKEQLGNRQIQMAQLTDEVAEMAKHISDQDEQIIALQAEKELLLGANTSENPFVEVQVQMQKQKHHLEEMIGELRQQIEDSEARYGSLTEDYTSLQTLHDNMVSLWEEKAHTLLKEDPFAPIDAINVLHSALLTELNRVHCVKDNFETLLKTADSRVVELQEQLLETEGARLQEQKDGREKVTQLLRQVEAGKKDCTDIQVKLEVALEKVSTLEAWKKVHADDMKVSLGEQEQQAPATPLSPKKAAKQEAELAKKKAADLFRESVSVAKRSEEASTLKQAIQEKDEEIKILRWKIDSLHQREEVAKAQNDRLSLSRIEEGIRTAVAECERQEAAADVLRKEIIELSHSGTVQEIGVSVAKQSDTLSKQSQEEVSALKEAIQEKDEEIKGLHGEIAQLKHNMNTMHDEYMRLVEKNVSEREEMQSMRDDLAKEETRLQKEMSRPNTYKDLQDVLLSEKEMLEMNAGELRTRVAKLEQLTERLTKRCQELDYQVTAHSPLTIKSGGVRDSTDVIAISSKERMVQTADFVMMMAREKEDVLAELCANFGNIELDRLATCAQKLYEASGKNVRAKFSPLDVLIMALYTCEGIDIDRKLGFPNVPDPLRPEKTPEDIAFNAKQKELLQAYIPKCESVYQVINKALREQDLTVLTQWCRYISHLAACCEPQQDMGTLYRYVKDVPEDISAQLAALKCDERLYWTQATSCTQVEEQSRNSTEGSLFIVTGPVDGIPFTLFYSQYPQEAEVLLSPFSTFRVISNDRGGHEIRLEAQSTLPHHAEEDEDDEWAVEFSQFLREVRGVWFAEAALKLQTATQHAMPSEHTALPLTQESQTDKVETDERGVGEEEIEDLDVRWSNPKTSWLQQEEQPPRRVSGGLNEPPPPPPPPQPGVVSTPVPVQPGMASVPKNAGPPPPVVAAPVMRRLSEVKAEVTVEDRYELSLVQHYQDEDEMMKGLPNNIKELKIQIMQMTHLATESQIRQNQLQKKFEDHEQELKLTISQQVYAREQLEKQISDLKIEFATSTESMRDETEQKHRLQTRVTEETAQMKVTELQIERDKQEMAIADLVRTNKTILEEARLNDERCRQVIDKLQLANESLQSAVAQGLENIATEEGEEKSAAANHIRLLQAQHTEYVAHLKDEIQTYKTNMSKQYMEVEFLRKLASANEGNAGEAESWRNKYREADKLSKEREEECMDLAKEICELKKKLVPKNSQHKETQAGSSEDTTAQVKILLGRLATSQSQNEKLKAVEEELADEIKRLSKMNEDLIKERDAAPLIETKSVTAPTTKKEKESPARKAVLSSTKDLALLLAVEEKKPLMAPVDEASKLLNVIFSHYQEPVPAAGNSPASSPRKSPKRSPKGGASHRASLWGSSDPRRPSRHQASRQSIFLGMPDEVALIVLPMEYEDLLKMHGVVLSDSVRQMLDCAELDILESVGENENVMVLTDVALAIFLKYTFIEVLNVDVLELRRAVTAVLTMYLGTNPFHNALHAVDVLQTMHLLVLHCEEKLRKADPIEIFSALFAALTHDVAHLGVTNHFLKTTNHKLVSLFCLAPAYQEAMHAAISLAVTRTHAFLPTSVSSERRAAFNKHVTHYIGQTDATTHACYIATASDTTIENDATALLSALIRLADISQNCKPTVVASKWALRAAGERLRQGALPTLPLAEKVSIGLYEATMIVHVLQPLLAILHASVPKSFSQYAELNVLHWYANDDDSGMKVARDHAKMPLATNFDDYLAVLFRVFKPSVKDARTQTMFMPTSVSVPSPQVNPGLLTPSRSQQKTSVSHEMSPPTLGPLLRVPPSAGELQPPQRKVLKVPSTVNPMSGLPDLMTGGLDDMSPDEPLEMLFAREEMRKKQAKVLNTQRKVPSPPRRISPPRDKTLSAAGALGLRTLAQPTHAQNKGAGLQGGHNTSVNLFRSRTQLSEFGHPTQQIPLPRTEADWARSEPGFSGMQRAKPILLSASNVKKKEDTA